jgi:hypothetical protein
MKDYEHNNDSENAEFVVRQISDLHHRKATKKEGLFQQLSLGLVFDIALALDALQRIDPQAAELLPFSSRELQWLVDVANGSADQVWFEESLSEHTSQSYGTRMADWLDPIAGGPYDGQVEQALRRWSVPLAP